LEGFSLAIAIVIGAGQFNNALGLIEIEGMKTYDSFHMNNYETFSWAGSSKPADYGCFIFFFLLLFILNLLPPPHHRNADGTKGAAKPKLPWLAVTSAFGLIWGAVTYYWLTAMKPTLLVDAFP